MAPVDTRTAEWELRDPDITLMLQVRDDVPGAFEVLVERYQNRLLGVMTHLVGDKEHAEDLAQEVFFRIYRARKGYRPRAKFSTWLFTIANNLGMNHLRGKGRNSTVEFGDTGASGSQPVLAGARGIPAPDGTASTQSRRAELAAIVRQAVANLVEDQRMAVLLNKFERMGYAEIASVMNRTEPAVKSLLAQARMNLREQLGPYMRPGDRIG